MADHELFSSLLKEADAVLNAAKAATATADAGNTKLGSKAAAITLPTRAHKPGRLSPARMRRITFAAISVLSKSE